MRQALFMLAFLYLYYISSAQPPQISGFAGDGVTEELKTEKKFDDLINAQNIGLTIRDLSSRPHQVGSPGSKEVAEKIQQKFRDDGFAVHTDVYQVLFPTPKVRILEMTSPARYDR